MTKNETLTCSGAPLKNWKAFPVIIAQTTTKQAAIITNTRVELYIT